MIRAILAVSLVLALGACSDDDTLELMLETDVSQFISAEKALDTARGEVPGGIPIEMELEIEDDDDEPAAWEVEMFDLANSRIVEVEIHAITGAVLEVEVEDDDDDDDDDDD